MNQTPSIPSRFEHIAKGVAVGGLLCIISPWNMWINIVLGGLAGLAFYLMRSGKSGQAAALCLNLSFDLAVYAFLPGTMENIFVRANWFGNPQHFLPLIGIESLAFFLLGVRFAFLAFTARRS